jgi:hypothetical protein
MTMWLPTPVYKSIPQFWFLLGLLFIVNGLYVGLDIPFALTSIYAGFGCCAVGIGIAILRQRYRQNKSSSSIADDKSSDSESSLY